MSAPVFAQQFRQLLAGCEAEGGTASLTERIPSNCPAQQHCALSMQCQEKESSEISEISELHETPSNPAVPSDGSVH